MDKWFHSTIKWAGDYLDASRFYQLTKLDQTKMATTSEMITFKRFWVELGCSLNYCNKLQTKSFVTDDLNSLLKKRTSAKAYLTTMLIYSISRCCYVIFCCRYIANFSALVWLVYPNSVVSRKLLFKYFIEKSSVLYSWLEPGRYICSFVTQCRLPVYPVSLYKMIKAPAVHLCYVGPTSYLRRPVSLFDERKSRQYRNSVCNTTIAGNVLPKIFIQEFWHLYRAWQW